MGRRLHIVATCTDRKSVAPSADLLVRNLPRRHNGTPDVGAWLQRREEADGPTVDAADLYMGELWKATLRLRDLALATGRDVALWVISAGYGLVRSDAPLRSYGATFAGGAADSVGGAGSGIRTSHQAAAWWRGLTNSPLAPDAPASLGELAQETVEDELLLVMSASYLEACREDLLSVPEWHRSAVLVSAGAAEDPVHARWAVDFDARAQGGGRPLSGSRISLNVRMAEHLVEALRDDVLDRASSAHVARDLMAGLGEVPSYAHRVGATDDEVLEFARGMLRADAAASASSALRRFRDEEQRACEQKRFARIFREARREMMGVEA